VLRRFKETYWQCVLAYNFLGYVYRTSGAYDQARECYRTALREYPSTSIEKSLTKIGLNELALITGQLDSVVDDTEKTGVSNMTVLLSNRINCRNLYVLSLLYGRKGNVSKQEACLRAIMEEYVYQPYVLVAQYYFGLITEKDFFNRINDYWLSEKNDLFCGLAEILYQRKEYGRALGYYNKALENSNKALDLLQVGYSIEYNDIFFLLAQKRVKELEGKGIK
jgi:tetratricopeptide (TPR) repeat protein